MNKTTAERIAREHGMGVFDDTVKARWHQLQAELERLRGRPRKQEPKPSTGVAFSPQNIASSSTPPTTSHNDPVAEFTEAVSKLVDRGMSRHQAIQRVANEQPTLHQRFVAATNEKSSDGGGLSPADAKTIIAGFASKVEAVMLRTGCDRYAAVQHIQTTCPRLHQAFVEATNLGNSTVASC